MTDVSQLLRKNNQGGYKNIFPKTYLNNIIDKESGMTLSDILSGFNMYFLSYTGSREETRLQVPSILRRTGLWVTYVMWDKTIVVEWYASDNISDAVFKEDANWRVGNNVLVGDITISSEGNWVINGVDSGIKAQGEQGITPILRVNNNKLEVSYTNGASFNVLSDYIAAWFRWVDTGNGVGKIQISRDNSSWSDLSPEFTNNLKIADYVSSVSELPSGVALGTIYGVGPTYDSSDTSHTNPIYTLYVYTNDGWLDNGHFTSIAAGIVQTIGDDENVVMSQKAICDVVGLNDYPTFSAAKVYFAGDVVNYSGKLYKFTADHAVGAWTGTDVEPYNLKKDIEERYGIYTDNPEFIRVYTDAEGKFLWGIRVDGTIEWAKGIPTPIQNALRELENKLSGNISSDVEDLKEALETKTKGLQDAIDLINVALEPLTDTFNYQDNDEFINVVTDNENKVLFGIKSDGTPYFPKNSMYQVANNQEFLAAWLDANNKVLFGIRIDGSTYVAKSNFLDKIEEIRQLLEDNGIGDDELKQRVEALEEDVTDLQDTFSHQENEEFAYVVTDNEGKVLFGIKIDGIPYYPNNEMYHVIQNDEYLAAWVDASNKLLFGIKNDGSIYIAKSEYIDAVKKIQAKIESLSESVQPLTETFSIVSNDEWLHAVVDAEGKLLFGIKAENGEVVMPKQDTYKVVSNDEWLAAWLDSQDRILFGVKADGTFWAAKHNFSTGGNYDEQIEDINNTLSSMQGTIKDLVDKIADIDTSGIANTVFSVIDDAEERLAVTTDKDGRIISYRYKDGVLHENKGFDTSKYYLNGEEKDFTDRSEIEGEVTKAAENGAVKLENVEGVSNHNTPNLLIADEMQKTFNDGKNSFTPPNAGYEMSNPIECQAGDWFTRTGTATGMVVVTDENDKNGTRLFNADGTTLGNTFQVPTNMTWVRYIRMAAEVTGAEEGTVVICKGKNAYTASDRGDYLTVDKLRLQKANIPKDIKYLKSSDGKYWELYVDDSHVLKIREIDSDIITELPSNFPIYTISGDFSSVFNTWVSMVQPYLMERNINGVIKYYWLGVNNANAAYYADFRKEKNSAGNVRYVVIYPSEYIGPNGEKHLTIYDEDFNVIDTNIGDGDAHDFVYFDDDHVATFRSDSGFIDIPVNNQGEKLQGVFSNTTVCIEELRKINGVWSIIGQFRSIDYPELSTDQIGIYDNTPIEQHFNTLFIDYDNNYVVNLRDCDSFIKIKRAEKSANEVIIGSETKDYNEAIIGRVGGKYNSGYLDSKRVLEDGFAFTDVPQLLTDRSTDEVPEWHWFHAHDVAYWGMKTIGDKQYPTYTLFDNNMWTGNELSGSYNDINPRNNYSNNPQGNDDHYFVESKSDDGGAYDTNMVSRVVQLSIDWENHKIMDFRVYLIPKQYSYTRSGAQMFDEGVLFISWADQHICGLYDFNDEQTEVSNNVYKNGKELFKVSTSNTGFYRVHGYKSN